jgi:hypothetical protein
MKKLTIGSIFVGLFLVNQAQAEWRGYDDYGHQDVAYNKIERRQDRQHHRIEKGINSGQLTRREAKKLWRQHHKIVELANCYIEDGYLSRKEKHILMARFDDASDRIYRFKHNRKHRKNSNHYSSGRGYNDRQHYDNNRFSISLAGGAGEHSDFYINW